MKKIKDFIYKNGPMLAMLVVITSVIKLDSAWTSGQAEAPEELL